MSKILKNKIALFLIALSFFNLFALTSHAKDIDTNTEKVITKIVKGENAPYDGFLLTNILSASIQENCNSEIIKKRCDIQIESAVSLSENSCTKETNVLKTRNLAIQTKHDEIISAKDKEIEQIRALSKPPAWFESPTLWGSIGFFLGGSTVYLIAKNIK